MDDTGALLREIIALQRETLAELRAIRTLLGTREAPQGAAAVPGEAAPTHPAGQVLAGLLRENRKRQRGG